MSGINFRLLYLYVMTPGHLQRFFFFFVNWPWHFYPLPFYPATRGRTTLHFHIYQQRHIHRFFEPFYPPFAGQVVRDLLPTVGNPFVPLKCLLTSVYQCNATLKTFKRKFQILKCSISSDWWACPRKLDFISNQGAETQQVLLRRKPNKKHVFLILILILGHFRFDQSQGQSVCPARLFCPCSLTEDTGWFNIHPTIRSLQFLINENLATSSLHCAKKYD